MTLTELAKTFKRRYADKAPARPRQLPAQQVSPAMDKRPYHIQLNGENVETSASTVSALLAEQGYGNRKVATALNGTFLPEQARSAKTLTEGDSLEVLSARQGG